jgi:hypothetical protein
MREAAAAASPMTQAAAARVAAGEAQRRRSRREFDRAEAEAGFNRLVAAVMETGVG